MPSEDVFYVFRGNTTTDWWKYNPVQNAFVGPADLPQPPGTGADFVSGDNGLIYYRRGSTGNTYHSYNPATNAWTTLAAPAATTSNDSRGVLANGLLYYFQGGGTAFYQYSISGGTWTTLTVSPVAAGSGNSLAYPGSGNYIYAITGNSTGKFMRYNISGNSWDDAGVADLPAGAEMTIGSRLFSNGTDIFAITAIGVPRLLKYTVGTNTWSVVGDLPFAPYHGTDLAYYNGKVYVLYGFYKSGVWEYTIASNTWRYLSDLPYQNQYNQGPYAGASIAIDQATGIAYVTYGNSSTRLLTFPVTAFQYPANGTWTSDVYDLSYVSAWNDITAQVTTPGNSNVQFETRSSSNKSSWSAWQALSGTTIQSPVARYIQVRATLTATSDRQQTPTLSGFTIGYTGDSTEPVNPVSVTGSSQQVGGTPLVSNVTYKYTNPYFAWPVGTDSESSVAGYYVYFGTSATATPSASGMFITTTDYTTTNALQNGTYYLRLQTKDVAGNISAPVTLFIYKYAGVVPTETTNFTNTSNFTGTAANVDIGDDHMHLSGAPGFWEQERLSLITATSGYGANFAYTSGDNTLYTFRGGNTNTFYKYVIGTDTWTTLTNAPTTVYGGGAVIEGPSGYLYAIPGNNTTTFWRYTIGTNSWTTLAAAPLAFNYGASLIYDGDNYLYVLRGNSDDAFMRYNISADSWDTLPNVDFGAPIKKVNNNVYTGGSLAYDGQNTLYAIQGNTYAGFASFNMTTNTWTVQPDVPMLPNDGAQLSYDATTNAVYYIPGNSTPYLYKFDIATDTWSQLADAPDVIRQGGAMRNVNGTLYVLRGNAQNFWKYSIANNTWKRPTVGLFGGEFRNVDIRPFGAGAAIIKGDGDYIYILRGNSDSLFVRYNTRTGEATQRADIPVIVSTDTALTYVPQEGKIYAVTTNVNYMYSYDIATDTWAKVGTDVLTANPGAGTSLIYDGSQYIYYIRGAGTNALYRYNRTGTAGSRWATMATATGVIGAGSKAVYVNNYLYVPQGNNAANNPFYRYNISNNTWATMMPLTGYTVTTGGFTAWDNEDGIYLCRGGDSNLCFRYSIGSNAWSAIVAPPANINAGGSAAADGNGRMYVIAGTGTNSYPNGLYSYVMRTTKTGFIQTGTYTSQVHDVGMVYRFAHLEVDYSASPGAALSVETRSSPDNSTWSSWSTATLQSTSDLVRLYKLGGIPQRYMQVRFTFESDGVFSGVLDGYLFRLYNDNRPPDNPTAMNVYDTASKTAELTSNTWHNAPAPYFEWPNEDETGGATDTATGSGVMGYYVYFGTNPNAVPATDGVWQTGHAYTASSLTSGSTYYFRLQSKDNASNIAADIWAPYIYKLDNTAPNAPNTVSVSPQGYSRTNAFSFTWTPGNDAESQLAGYCYKTDAPSAVESCVTDATVSAVLAYTGGANTFKVRAKDIAGNYSDYKTTTYYYSSLAPTSPQNLEVQTISSENNLFSFSWNAPESYYGPEDGLRYYFSVNASPSANTVQTSIDTKGGNGISQNFISPGEYATLPGKNELYLVAKDASGNIDYANWAKVEFQAQTSAPGVPRNVDIADLSVKTTENWRLNVSWEPPVATGSGIKSYKVYRSTTKDAQCSVAMDPFQFIASSVVVATNAAELKKGSAYTDPSLDQQTYYYCVRACNSTDQCSAPSDTVSSYPDGKWTEAAIMTASPSATVTTKTAIISWATSRSSNSFVSYGKTSGKYDGESGSSEQVTEHEINLPSLDPGTTYYYVVKWTDEDGNEGISSEQSFSTAPAPAVSNVKITSASITSAFITFTINHANSAIVQYGKSLSYGMEKTVATSTSESTYTIKLDDLTEGTQYNLRVVAQDEEGNSYPSDNYTFETLPTPKIVQLKIQQVVGMPTATLRLTWGSNTDIATVVTYYPEENPAAAKDFVNLVYTTKHEAILKDLKDDVMYVLAIKGRDVAGNEAQPQTQRIKTATDFRPPDVSNLDIETTITGVGDEAKAKIIMSWDTDEPATTQVEYGPGAGGPYQSSTQEDKSLTLNHSVTITGLNPASIYHLRPVTKDKAGNVAPVNDSVIITPQSTKGALELVVDNLSKTFGFLKSLNAAQ